MQILPRPIKSILIAGASGFIGKALQPFLESNDYIVHGMNRTQPKSPYYWNPPYTINSDSFKNIDAIINLAGSPVICRWTNPHKHNIYHSRVQTTQFLCKTLASLEKKPSVLINASAIGIYGVNREESVTENSPPPSPDNQGFLYKVCHDWEAATLPAKEASIRVINLRIGIVIHPSGGMLAKSIPLFKLYLGSLLGNGSQYFSWIVLLDLLRIFHFCLTHPSLNGPINATSPFPISNKVFTHALANALKRKAFLPPVPSFLLKSLLGKQMAQETVLSNLHVIPQKLLDSGFEFYYPTLPEALQHLL